MLDRLRAHLAEGGALEAGTALALLAHAEGAAGDATASRQVAGTVAVELDRVLACLEVWKHDAARLAAWIVAHPGGHEDVLALHDQTVRDYSA